MQRIVCLPAAAMAQWDGEDEYCVDDLGSTPEHDTL